MLRRLYSHLVWLIFPCRAAGIEERVGRYVTKSVLLIGILMLIGILHIPNRERFKTLGILSTFNFNAT